MLPSKHFGSSSHITISGLSSNGCNAGGSGITKAHGVPQSGNFMIWKCSPYTTLSEEVGMPVTFP